MSYWITILRIKKSGKRQAKESKPPNYFWNFSKYLQKNQQE
jgi:hypothetical protein